jgi:hypothetical protein
VALLVQADMRHARCSCDGCEVAALHCAAVSS